MIQITSITHTHTHTPGTMMRGQEYVEEKAHDRAIVQTDDGPKRTANATQETLKAKKLTSPLQLI